MFEVRDCSGKTMCSTVRITRGTNTLNLKEEHNSKSHGMRCLTQQCSQKTITSLIPVNCGIMMLLSWTLLLFLAFLHKNVPTNSCMYLLEEIVADNLAFRGNMLHWIKLESSDGDLIYLFFAKLGISKKCSKKICGQNLV